MRLTKSSPARSASEVEKSGGRCRSSTCGAVWRNFSMADSFAVIDGPHTTRRGLVPITSAMASDG